MSQDSLTQVGRTHTAPGGVEVLTAPDHAAPQAAAALGWDGRVLPSAELVGRRVVVVAELDAVAHEYRRTLGWGPVTDRMSVATWGWPEMADQVPPPAVRLRGVIAPARHWRTGLAAAVPFTGLCATAVLLPPGIARDAGCRGYADHHGCSVVATAPGSDMDDAGREAVDVVQQGRPGPLCSPRPTGTSRWVHEVVYERLLAGID